MSSCSRSRTNAATESTAWPMTGREVQWLPPEMNLALRDAGDVQQVLDEPVQGPDLVGGDPQAPLAVLPRVGASQDVGGHAGCCSAGSCSSWASMAMNSSFRRSASASFASFASARARASSATRQSRSRSSSSRLRSVMSSMARRISSHFPSGGKRRALSSIVFGPMCSKSCSTSKSSKELFSGMISSSKVLRAGMSHWPSPRS